MGYFKRMINGPPERDPFPVDSTVYSTDQAGKFEGFHRVVAVESGGWSVTTQPVATFDYYRQHESTAAAQLQHYAQFLWMAPEVTKPIGETQSMGIRPSDRRQNEDPHHGRGDYALRRADGSEMFLWDGKPLAVDTAGNPAPGTGFSEMWDELVATEAHERQQYQHFGDSPLEVGTILQAADYPSSDRGGFLQVTAEAFKVGEHQAHVVVRPIGQTPTARQNGAGTEPVGQNQSRMPTRDDFIGPARVERVHHDPGTGYYVIDGAARASRWNGQPVQASPTVEPSVSEEIGVGL